VSRRSVNGERKMRETRDGMRKREKRDENGELKVLDGKYSRVRSGSTGDVKPRRLAVV